MQGPYDIGGGYDPTLDLTGDPNLMLQDPNANPAFDAQGNFIGSAQLGGPGGGQDPSFWRTLLQNLVSGGGSSGGGGTAGGLGNVLAGAGSGLANQRSQQAQLATAQGNLQQKVYQDALQQALFRQIGAPASGAQMAKAGDLQRNVQDVTPQFTPGRGYSFTGGARPSAFGPNARAAGANLSQAGVNLQQNPQLPTLPQMPNFPSSTPGTLENILQGGGFGLNLLSAATGGNNPQNSFINQLYQQYLRQAQSPQGSGGSQTSTSGNAWIDSQGNF